MINLQCIAILVMYSDFYIEETYYVIIFHILLVIALVQFLGTVLYYLYINRLHKIKCINLLASKVKNIKFCYKFETRPSPSPPAAAYYEQLQEELLLEDPV